MSAFKNTDYEKYKDEVKEKWGRTEAYAEYTEKTKGYTKDEQSALADGMEEIFSGFSQCMNEGKGFISEEAQTLCKKLQQYITDNFYTCTKEILKGLGQMYVTDERFKENIDKAGSGTAEFVSKAIEVYCG